MTDNKTPKLNVEDRIELARWLIERHDTLRESISSRAGIILSADALLITALIFTLDKITAITDQGYSDALRIVFIICIAVSTISTIVSFIFTTNTIVSVWKTSRRTTNTKYHQRLFFNARDTLENFPTFSGFEHQFRELRRDQVLNFALGELWTAQSLYRQRYQSLRYSIRALLFSIIPFLIAMAIILFFIF